MPLGSVSGFGVASSSWWRWLVLVCLLGFCPWILSAQEQNRLQLAERYMQNGEADKALSLYEELYREDPQTFVYQGYLQCLQSLERYPEAEKLIRRQMKAAPQPLLLQIDLLQNFLLAGETKKARSNFEDFLSGLDIYGGSAVSLSEIAQDIVEKTRRYDWASALYVHVRELVGDAYRAVTEGSTPEYKLNRDFLKRAGSAAEARLYLRRLFGLGEAVPGMAWQEEWEDFSLFGAGKTDSPERYLYAQELADLYRKTGEYELMLDEYLKVLEKNPDQKEDVYACLQAAMASGGVSGGGFSDGVGSGAGWQEAVSQADGSKASVRVASRLSRLLYQRVQQHPMDETVQDMLVWVLLQQQDFETALLQAKAYSRRFEDGGWKWLETIRVVASNHRYELARPAYEEFVGERGESSASVSLSPRYLREAKIDLLDLYFASLENRKEKDSAWVVKLKQSYKRLLSELGRDPESFGLYRNLARIHAYYAGERDSARILLEEALASHRFTRSQQALLKIDLADILLYYNKVWDATLLYSQVEKDLKQDPVGFYAKLQNARLSYYIGEFEWAKSQLDVLRAATSKTIANDAMELSLLIKENMSPDSSYTGLWYVARSDFMAMRGLYAPALRLLDTLLTLPQEGGLFDEAWYRKAQIYLEMDSVSQALHWLSEVYTDYYDPLLVDDALFMAAELLQLRAGIPVPEGMEQAGAVWLPEAGSEVFGQRTEGQRTADKEESMRLYQRLFMEFKSSTLAALARQRYRFLRGDAGLQ